MNSPQTDDSEWIELRPSNVNLALTLVAPLCALAILFAIDMPDWVRAGLTLALLMVTIADLYFVRQRSARAIAAFRLILKRNVPAAIDDAATDSIDAAGRRATDELVIQLKYRYPGRAGGVDEVEGLVDHRCYVSTYFTSISYRLASDANSRRWFPRVLSIWADGIDKDAFRRVRVQLKWR